MAQLVMNLKDERNLQAQIAWCKKYHVEYQVIGTIEMPNGVVEDDTTTKNTNSNTKNSKDEDEVVELVDENKYTIGEKEYIVVYPTMLAVRHWNPDKFTPKNVMYAIKQSLKEAGASWNKELKAYQFTTKKAFNAWVKVQKDRETK